MKYLPLLIGASLAGCQPNVTEYNSANRHACASTSGSGSGSGSGGFDLASGGSSVSEGGMGEVGGGLVCPDLTGGVVEFCLPDMPCRSVYVESFGADGPLAIHWHGTFSSPENELAWGTAVGATRAMAQAEGGMLVLPYADPAAVSRPDTPFPWWIVGDCSLPTTECDRDDDFRLYDAVLECASYDPDRVVVSGMSAGGIMTSHLASERRYIAGAVSWSGGWNDQVALAQISAGNTPVLVVHGGDNDCYCGPGADDCYCFRQPSEFMGREIEDVGAEAIMCDHQAGHTDSLGNEGAEFMRLAQLGQPHPWYQGEHINPVAAQPFTWVVDNYCYAPGNPSPWD